MPLQSYRERTAYYYEDRRRPSLVKLPAQPGPARQSRYGRGYPVRPASVFMSLGIHGVAIALLTAIAPRSQGPSRPIYDELIRPQIHKIIWYDFRNKLPDVSPPRAAGMRLTPHAIRKSQRVLIVTSPEPKSTQQFVWRAAPIIQLYQDVPLPNLVARIEAPPPEAAKRAKPARAFTPPPAARQPRLPVQTPVIEAPVPVPSMLGNSNVVKSSIEFPPATVPTAPAPRASSDSPAPSPGNARIDIAVANLHPAKAAESVPEGERPGRFSEAPAQGPAATAGAAGPNALIVPDLTVRETNGKSAPAVRSGEKSILYSEIVRNMPASTLSVPLRPGSRRIPAAVDARFQGRYVYTIVIPMENLPPYAGDWILWFAERDQKIGDAPLMRAPIPFRKSESVARVLVGRETQQRVQIAAIISKDGEIRSISVLTKIDAPLQRVLIADLSSWRFQPATRDGLPVDAEVTIEIPLLIDSDSVTRQSASAH